MMGQPVGYQSLPLESTNSGGATRDFEAGQIQADSRTSLINRSAPSWLKKARYASSPIVNVIALSISFFDACKTTDGSDFPCTCGSSIKYVAATAAAVTVVNMLFSISKDAFFKIKGKPLECEMRFKFICILVGTLVQTGVTVLTLKACSFRLNGEYYGT